MTRYHVDVTHVENATHTARATISRLHADIQQLSHTLTDLQGSWGGTASSAFQSVFAEWRVTQGRVEEQLAQITEALGQAGRHYADMEAANQALFRR